MLGQFFDRVSRLSRLVNMGSIKIRNQATQTASNTIAASAVATTFVYVETPPAPPPGAPRPAGR
jgi:Tfp pilus assembly protein PilO